MLEHISFIKLHSTAISLSLFSGDFTIFTNGTNPKLNPYTHIIDCMCTSVFQNTLILESQQTSFWSENANLNPQEIISVNTEIPENFTLK